MDSTIAIQENTLVTNLDFLKDVEEGLQSNPKFLSSKYFYNKRGSELFQTIMQLEEYYPTRSEYEIFLTYKDKLQELFATSKFELLEFGAGDGLKTKILLEHFYKNKIDFTYSPIDISSDVLETLTTSLKQQLPDLSLSPLCGDYLIELEKQKSTSRKKVVFFLGSNVGNMSLEESLFFFRKIYGLLNEGDILIVGFDLKKDPLTILNAYNDKMGVTAAFNINLLKRINDELGGDFDLGNFYHYPTYDPKTGEAKSFIVSKRKQIVRIEKLNKRFGFELGECIHTEVSKKYTLDEIRSIAKECGFTMVDNLFDCKHYFTDSIWIK
jgi:dimethylhistidine N-methyltransferase